MHFLNFFQSHFEKRGFLKNTGCSEKKILTEKRTKSAKTDSERKIKKSSDFQNARIVLCSSRHVLTSFCHEL